LLFSIKKCLAKIDLLGYVCPTKNELGNVHPNFILHFKNFFRIVTKKYCCTIGQKVILNDS